MFEIVWSDEAFDQMQRLMLMYPNLRSQFGKSLREATSTLEDVPVSTGESREGYHRVGFFDPITVYFVVNIKESLVGITGVYLSPNAF
jgi:hypothetical protein